jgi:hypothetical protein
VRGAYERLLEIDGIVHDRDERQEIAMTDEMLDHGCVCPRRDPIALDHTVFHMRRRHLQLRAFDRVHPVTEPARR